MGLRAHATTHGESMDESVAILFALSGNEPPSEILLFAAGRTETKKGYFDFTAASAEAVMRAFEEDGLDRLPFDVGHGMLKGSDDPKAHKSFGWFVPAVRDGALYATDIQWTEEAREMLSKRAFRFYSPAIRYNEQREITGLINVALTNLPATKNQRPLVLDALEAEPKTETKDEKSMQILLDSLEASDESSAVAKVGEFKAALSALGCGVSEAKDAIAKLQAQAEKGIEAQAALAKIEKDRAAEKRAVKIEALCAEGKLLANQKEFAAELSDDQFERFSATLSAHKALSPASKIEEPHDKEETLSAEEVAAAAAVGLTKEEFIEARKAQKESK